MHCRNCQYPLDLPFLDLGSAPHSNAYLTSASLHEPEAWYPLRVLVCEHCWLVQTEDMVGADDLFKPDYAYFSSFSTSWLDHCRQYVEAMQHRFALDHNSRVIEIAANDGYLLQFFVQKKIPCIGIEPTAKTASAARARNIEIIEEFFDNALAARLAAKQLKTDLLVANNVLAHVPDINSFVAGIAQVLKPSGVATLEFPHLLNLIRYKQFDTVYHEHFSYLSLTSVDRIFQAHELVIFDVEQLMTHGGSLRIFAQRRDTGAHACNARVNALLSKEEQAGIKSHKTYLDFQKHADGIKNASLHFLLEANAQGQKVIGYGAAAKGNTLLNYAGVRRDLLPFVVDRNPFKQGQFLPGSRIPIVDESRLQEFRPDFVVILPWNLKQEIMKQLDYIREWGGRFVTFIPQLEIT